MSSKLELEKIGFIFLSVIIVLFSFHLVGCSKTNTNSDSNSKMLSEPENTKCFFNVDGHDEELFIYFESNEFEDYVVKQISADSNSIIAQPDKFVEITNFGKKIVPCLIKTLSDQKYSARIGAYWALRVITNKSFGSTDVYKNKNWDDISRINSHWIEWWIENSNKTQEEWFLEDLNSNDQNLRKTAIWKFVDLKDKSVIPTLQKYLKDPRINFDVACVLGDLGDKSIVPFLIKNGLENTNEYYRNWAILVLKHLANETFGFDPNESFASRNISVDKWKKWWKQNQK